MEKVRESLELIISTLKKPVLLARGLVLKRTISVLLFLFSINGHKSIYKRTDFPIDYTSLENRNWSSRGLF